MLVLGEGKALVVLVLARGKALIVLMLRGRGEDGEKDLHKSPFLHLGRAD